MSPRFSVVLSGGGCKAFWSVGVLDVLEPAMPAVDHWAGASAGAAMALSRVAGRFEHGFSRFLESVAANQRNFYPSRVLKRERPFPHNDIYRDAIRFMIRGEGFTQIRDGAPVHMLLSYVHAGQPFVATTLERGLGLRRPPASLRAPRPRRAAPWGSGPRSCPRTRPWTSSS